MDETTNRGSAIHRLTGWLSRLGTGGYPPRIVRRLTVINIMAAIATVLTLLYIPPYALYDFQGLRPVLYLLLVQAAAWAATPFFHRFGDLAAALYFFAVWMIAMTFFAYTFGRGGGTHFYFLPGAAALLLFLGLTRIKLVAALLPLPVVAFLASEKLFTGPADFIRTDPWLLDSIYYFSVAGAYLIIFVAVYYSFQLARTAEEALEREYARSETLLDNLLPEQIAERLKSEPEEIIADDLGQVTILFADIVDFTPRAATLSPPALVAFLNGVFTAFDRLAERHGLEKIKTIGDAYMAAAGMPEQRDDHAVAVAEMALDMLDVTAELSRTSGDDVAVRIGMHTGPVVAGVIGTRKFFYDVWGDTVNTAARMESHGEPGRIQVTPETRAALEGLFAFEERGEIEVKGKGRITTWWLSRRT